MTTKKVITIIILLIVVASGAYLFDRYFLKKDNSKIVEKPFVDNLKEEKEVTSEQTNGLTKEKLVYLTSSEDVSEILSIDAQGKEKKVLFTDKDEDLKIKKVADIATQTQQLLVYFGKKDESFGGNLSLIKLDSSGKKEELVGNIGEPKVISISPDGQKIAFVYFSNVEESYGYNVLVMSRNGENKREVYRNEKEITFITWDNSSSKIAVVVKAERSTLNVLDTDSAQNKEIYSTSEVILTPGWQEDGKIIFTEANSKLENGTLYSMDEGGDKKKLLETQNGLAVFGSKSSDRKSIAYLATSYEGEFKETEGEVKIAQTNGENIQKVARGTQILGWLQ